MQDLNDKITGGTLTALEWNEVPSEIQNVIEGLGITLSSGDLNQLGKAIAGYVANGAFYTDSGAADAYVLTKIGSKQSVTAYTDGLEAEFIADNPNTGASTVNVATLGVKNIKLRGGADPAAGEIDGRVRIKFDSANDRFELIRTGVLTTIVTVTDATWTPQPDTKTIQFTALGGGAGGGGTDGQGAGTAVSSGPGASGSTAIKMTNIIDSTYAITIGAGGAGGAAGNNGGTVGGTTTIVSTNVNISCPGGFSGPGMLGSSGQVRAAGASGAALATGGDINAGGTGTDMAVVQAGFFASAPASAPSIFGGSVRSQPSANGSPGNASGAGGGGNHSEDDATNFAGGDGANGVVVVREYF